jgi:SAM-dependent methyltransferase
VGGDVRGALIAANGYDTGFGDYDLADWERMIESIVAMTGVCASSRVLELGCGAGAFLYELSRQTQCQVNGVDYSASMIAAARRCLPFGRFEVAEAKDLSGIEGPFDAIFSHGVFIYFPDQDYVRNVLAASVDKLAAGGALCIQDLNDIDHKATYDERRRRSYRNPDAYDRDYVGLSHLFFDKAAILEDLKTAGLVEGRMFDHASRRYQNAQYRFNVIAWKSAEGPATREST